MKLLTALKRITFVAAIGAAGWKAFNWLHGRPSHTQQSKALALRDLLEGDGYVAKHQFPPDSVLGARQLREREPQMKFE